MNAITAKDCRAMSLIYVRATGNAESAGAEIRKNLLISACELYAVSYNELNEEEKMQQSAGHRTTIEEGDPELRHKSIPAERNERGPSFGVMQLRKWETVHNNDNGGKAG